MSSDREKRQLKSSESWYARNRREKHYLRDPRSIGEISSKRIYFHWINALHPTIHPPAPPNTSVRLCAIIALPLLSFVCLHEKISYKCQCRVWRIIGDAISAVQFSALKQHSLLGEKDKRHGNRGFSFHHSQISIFEFEQSLAPFYILYYTFKSILWHSLLVLGLRLFTWNALSMTYIHNTYVHII